MAVATNIMRSYAAPRQVMRTLLADGTREDRALVYLMGGCALIFLAQWPRLAREAHLDPSIPLDARMAGALWGWLFVVPLMAYAAAAVTHVLARIAGGRGSFYAARLALFWSLLASAPLFLLSGVIVGFLGTGAVAAVLGIATLAGFLFLWGVNLFEAERDIAVAQAQAGE